MALQYAGTAVGARLPGAGTRAITAPRRRLRRLTIGLALGLTVGLTGGCADGAGTEPTLGSVVITAPTTPPTLQTLGRTVQLTAEARRSSGALATNATISWSSSEPSVATVSATGLVTAVGNGTAQIRAIASPGGIQSPPLPVTVAQVANGVTITPSTVVIAGVGGTRQLAAAEIDSSNAPLPGTPTVTWTRVGPGTIASVSAAGLVTALAEGTGDSAVATIGARIAKAPITVTASSSAPTAIGVTVGDNFFRSNRNSTQNTAIDTVAIGGTVTWTWVATANLHNVQSLPSPTFTSSVLQSSGQHQVIFGAAGTYQYDCQVHPGMTGRIVVR